MAISQSGSGDYAVQIDPDNGSITIAGGDAFPARPHRRRPRRLLDLLDPYRQAIDVVGRADDLAALETWLDGPLPITVRCLTGRAGSGKTRLALELCVQARKRGWLAGFANHDALAATVDWRWPRATLIVLDDAAAAVRALRGRLVLLAERQAVQASKLRLLLLERHASADEGWWAELTRFGGTALENLIDPPRPTRLPGLRTTEQRREVLQAAMAAASRLDGLDPLLQPPAPGTDPSFEARLADDRLDNEPLYLMMAGVTAVRARVPQVLAMGCLDLAHQIAAAEIERLAQVARSRGLDGAFLQHLAACVTLTNGISRDGAEALVRDEQRALHLPAINAAAVVAVLADALPAQIPGVVDAMRPDLIGEAAILATFARAGHSVEQQAQIVERAWRRSSTKTVATVIRVARDHAPADGEHPSLAWLHHLAKLVDDPLELTAMADAFPSSTMSMGVLVADLRERIVEKLRAAGISGDAGRSRLAVALDQLAVRLTAIGRHDQAMAAAEEVARIYTELAASRPRAFRPQLAASLNNLANVLGNVGRREPALTAALEATKLYRELAAARPKDFRRELAASLNNLANMLGAVGRPEPALEAAVEVVAIHRELAASEPVAFRPDLASSLGNLAVRLHNLGGRESALAASQEAVALCRELAAVRPDAFRPQLAGSLDNLAVMLGDLDHRGQALEAALETVAIRRELAAARPEAFRADLAGSLHNLASRLGDLGRLESALAAAEEAVKLYRTCAAVRPEAFRPSLAMALDGLGLALGGLGRREQALAAVEEAVVIRRELAAAQPEAFGADLAGTLNNLANMLSNLGRHEPALAVADEAARHFRSLAAARPRAFRPALAMACHNLANRLHALDRLEPALEAASEAVAIRRELAAAQPESFRADLAGSLNSLGYVLAGLGRAEPALDATLEAVAIGRELVATHPETLLPDLATSLCNLAGRLDSLCRPEPALEAASEAVVIRRKLAADRPDAFRPQLAVSLSVLAKCLESGGRPGDALQASAEAVEALSQPFLQLPGAFAQNMMGMLQQYIDRCRVLGLDADEALLEPLVPALRALVNGAEQREGNDRPH